MLHSLRQFRRIVGRLRRREQPFILMYHRVASLACDPWQLAIRPRNFDAQIGALVHMRQVVPLRWLVRELVDGRIPYGTAAVTFDDGYADVLVEAKPVLERYGCPATMFLTTGAIGSVENFWWDELSHLLLESTVLPPALEIEIGGRMYGWPLENSPKDTVAKAGTAEAYDREALHLALWKALRPLAPAARRRHLDTLARWAGSDLQPRLADRAIAAEDVRRLSEPGFIDIGAHSVTHPTMPSLDPAARQAELVESKRTCEQLTGVPADGFAYPFGDYDDACIASVRKAGFAFACSTKHAMLTKLSDTMRLPRLAVGDWEAEPFVNWLTREMRVHG